MKWKTLMVTATLSTLLLAGCGTDNANDTAMRNQDNTLRNVNYNPNNNNGYPNQNNNYGYPNGNDNVINRADRNNNGNRTLQIEITMMVNAIIATIVMTIKIGWQWQIRPQKKLFQCVKLTKQM